MKTQQVMNLVTGLVHPTGQALCEQLCRLASE